MNNKTIENIKNYFGITKAQSKQYLKTATQAQIEAINQFYNIQSKKTFYED